MINGPTIIAIRPCSAPSGTFSVAVRVDPYREGFALPWGEENRCTAVSRRGNRCKRRVSPTHVWIIEDDPTVAWMHESEYRMLASLLCNDHRPLSIVKGVQR